MTSPAYLETKHLDLIQLAQDMIKWTLLNNVDISWPDERLSGLQEETWSNQKVTNVRFSKK
jgi:hypothetical protein